MTIFPPSLQLNLSGNKLCGVNIFGEGTYNAEGITAIADALRVTASLTSIGKGGLNLKNNSLGDKGWGEIFAGVCSSEESKISSIDASKDWIGPEGAKLIAEALRTSVTASLTEVR